MTEEEKALSGEWFYTEDDELVAKKAKAHRLSQEFNNLFEDQKDERNRILHDLIGEMGEDCAFTYPIFFHYGCHTKIGHDVFFNTGLTIQDDGEVIIGNNCLFGPNLTIVTPLHPLDPDKRRCHLEEDGVWRIYCKTKKVEIGNDCWFGANVTVCPGAKIGNNCVIGAGSVITGEIPDNSIAVGVPCKVLRKIQPGENPDFKTIKPRVTE